MLDYDKFESNFLAASDTGNSKLDIRRLMLALSTDIHPDWSAKYKVEVSNGIKVKDAFVNYKGWDIANITIGNQYEPFGMERLMSTKDIPMIERTMVTSAVAPGRNLGINLSGSRGLINWQVGYFQKDNTQRSNAVTGRVTWNPWRKDRNLLHLGVAVSQRNLHGEIFRVNRNMEVHNADKIVKGNKIEADSAYQTGLELLWQNNGVVNMAEWQQSTVTGNDGKEFHYRGGYYQIIYSFSRKNRKYKKGILGGIDGNKDWEATFRFSQLNMAAENSQSKIFSLGLNYSLNNRLKFMANILNARYVEEGERLDAGYAVSLRAQYRL